MTNSTLSLLELIASCFLVAISTAFAWFALLFMAMIVSSPSTTPFFWNFADDAPKSDHELWLTILSTVTITAVGAFLSTRSIVARGCVTQVVAIWVITPTLAVFVTTSALLLFQWKIEVNAFDEYVKSDTCNEEQAVKTPAQAIKIVRDLTVSEGYWWKLGLENPAALQALFDRTPQCCHAKKIGMFSGRREAWTASTELHYDGKYATVMVLLTKCGRIVQMLKGG